MVALRSAMAVVLVVADVTGWVEEGVLQQVFGQGELGGIAPLCEASWQVGFARAAAPSGRSDQHRRYDDDEMATHAARSLNQTVGFKAVVRDGMFLALYCAAQPDELAGG